MDENPERPEECGRLPQSTDIREFQTNPYHRKWHGRFSFVLGADPQFGMIGTCKLKLSEATWKPEMTLTREAIQRVNAMVPRPKFFLVCGDMLDAFPFEKEEIRHFNNNDISIRDLQYTDFMDVFRKELDPEIKLIFAPGNHDVGDVPTSATLVKYRKEFGPDYFSFWVGGVKFVVLNSQFFVSPDAVPHETERHQQWIEEHVEDPSAKYIVVFQHIPFFGSHPSEESMHYNIPKERRLVLLEQLWRAGVRYVFSGHYHRNAGGQYKTLEEIVTGAMGAPFGEDPSGFRVFHVSDFEISSEYVKLRETTDCSEFEVKDQPASLIQDDLPGDNASPSHDAGKALEIGGKEDISNSNCSLDVPETGPVQRPSDNRIMGVDDKVEITPSKESVTSLGKSTTYSGRDMTPSTRSVEVDKSRTTCASISSSKRKRQWVWCCGARMLDEDHN